MVAANPRVREREIVELTAALLDFLSQPDAAYGYGDRATSHVGVSGVWQPERRQPLALDHENGALARGIPLASPPESALILGIRDLCRDGTMVDDRYK